MIRALAICMGAVLLAACLDPEKPYLSVEDGAPPVLMQSRPARGGAILDILPANDPLALVFSEELEVRSLRPGISVRKDNKDVDITVFAQGDGGTATNTYDFTGRDKPYAVGIRRSNGLLWETTGTYTLRLNTLLIDTEGNALEEEIDIRFQATSAGDGGT